MRIDYTVECIRNCHFRVTADYPDADGKLTKLWNPICPYCGTALFKRWWRHEVPDPEETQDAVAPVRR